MANRKRGMRQKAVLWPATNDGDAADYDNYGEIKLEPKKEIRCRWETKRNQSVDPQGQTIAFDEIVVVDEEIKVGSIMWKGKLCELPTTPTNLREVVNYQEIPDIKGRNPERVVMLTRYSDSLPTLS